jgi:hypothetical protein
VAGAQTLPVVEIRATDATAAEVGPTTGTYTVSRSGDTTSALIVAYVVGGSALAGTDYIGLPGSVTIPVGASSATVVVTPIADSVAEPTETVVATLVASASYSVGERESATIRIRDSAPGRDDGEENEHGGVRPGHGWGDRNHDHVGPPGRGCTRELPCTEPEDHGVVGAAKSDEKSNHGHRRGRGRGRD